MFRNAYVLLLLTTLFWGGNAVAGKFAVGHISPMALNTLRWGGASLLLLIIGWKSFARDWPVTRRNLALLFALGAAGFTLFNAAMYSALVFTSAINVSIEQAGVPMLIFVANFLLYRIRVAPGQIVGFTMSVVGVVLTAAHGDFSRLAELDLNRGDLIMLAGIAAYAGYTVALRYKPAIHWQSMALSLSVAALVSSLPFTAWEWHAGNAVAPDRAGWGVVLYAAVFPSILAQVFYIRGVELIGANRTGLFINMVPIFGTLLSVVLLGEAFHLYHAVALVMVLGGIWLAEHSGRKHAAVKA